MNPKNIVEYLVSSIEPRKEILNIAYCRGKEKGKRIESWINTELLAKLLELKRKGHIDEAEGEPAWSEWFDITDDENAPSSWRWDDIYALDCKVKSVGSREFVLYCSKIELRVNHTSPANNAPQISNPYPVDGSSGISLTPTLNITVSDADADTMNITWYSNSSGSWVAFGYNNSVVDGTYHQIFANATVNGQWWYWKVKVDDGIVETESSVYKFYTGVQSKIVNSGSTGLWIMILSMRQHQGQ